MKHTLILFLVLSLGSCGYNVEEMPAPEAVPVFTGPTITYSLHTKRLFDTYCIACHSVGQTQSFYPFTTYSEIKLGPNTGIDYTISGTNSIEQRVLIFGNMPPSGSASGFLTTAEKDTLQWWLAQGAPQ